jgi:pimeloyl-ACP methyl ester carboxylesterase
VDLWFARRNGKKLAKLIPNAEFELMRDSRTFIPEDQPEALARSIRRFLDRTSERSAENSIARRPAG